MKKVDVFVSFNDLGYVKDIPLFLKNLKNCLSKKGKFCFYLKSSFLNVTPNALIFSDKKKTTKIFKEAKLKIGYVKKKSLFTTEIYLYGKK